jgi:hypothetical protein
MVKGNNSEVIFNTTIQNRFSDLISLATFVDHVYIYVINTIEPCSCYRRYTIEHCQGQGTPVLFCSNNNDGEFLPAFKAINLSKLLWNSCINLSSLIWCIGFLYFIWHVYHFMWRRLNAPFFLNSYTRRLSISIRGDSNSKDYFNRWENFTT